MSLCSSGLRLLREVYVAVEFIELRKELFIKLKNIERKTITWISISQTEMSEREILKKDLEEAPSIVMSTEKGPDGHREVGFLSGRLKSAVVLAVSNSRPQW